ncbi:MAG: sodium:solute symporter [Sedimentisphaeraceae bacterium JB056]
MFGFPLVDLIAIIVYFIAVMGIGVWASMRIKNEEDYFLGGRSFGKFVQTFAAFGQATSTDSSVGATVMVARNGIAGVTQSLISCFSLPIYWITCVWYRRLRTLTLGDFFEERYNSKWMPAFYSLISAMLFMLTTGISFMAMTKTVSAIAVKPMNELTVEQKAEYELAVELQDLEKMDARLMTEDQTQRLEALRLAEPDIAFSYINENVLVWIVAAVVLIYAVMGGLEAAFLTDTIQGVGIIILSMILVPFAFAKLNTTFGTEGITGVIEVARSQLPQAAFEVWGSPSMQDFTWYFILATFLMFNINVAIQPNQLTCSGSAKDEYTARVGFCAGIYMKRWATLAWAVTALVLVILYADKVSKPDYIWGVACRDLLGSLNIGLLGLMVACLMAALMSTADCLMLTVSSLITNNVYAVIVPGKSQKHYVWAGRVAGLLFILGAIGSVYCFDNIFYMIKLAWEFNIVLAASFWLGMKWRRANRPGAWCSMIITLVVFGLLPAFVPLVPGVKTNDYLLKATHPKEATRSYVAREVDVERRQQDIELWGKLNAAGKAEGEKPVELAVGDRFDKVYNIPKKSIFWSQDLGVDDEGNVIGKGMINFELILLDKLGFDLQSNPYALNETIRYIIRIIFPFAVLMIVSLFTKPEDKKRLDLFYVKMKTPANADREQDVRDMELSVKDPARFDHKKMFPNSNWEFEKFDNLDMKGIVWYTVAAVVIIAAVYGVSYLGK